MVLGAPYCEHDYGQLFCPRCANCTQPILDKCVSAAGKKFHPGLYYMVIYSFIKTISLVLDAVRPSLDNPIKKTKEMFTARTARRPENKELVSEIDFPS